MKKLLVISVALNLVFIGLLLWKNRSQDRVSQSFFKPAGLKEGQCAIQVNGVKASLFEDMKAKCRVLVVLGADGRMQEIIEK